MARLIITHGLPGVGKTTLANKIRQITNGQILSTNYVRKNILGCDAFQCANVPLMPFSPAEIYLSYKIALYAAKLLLSLGKTVIIDATFQKRQYVEMAKEIAQETNAEFYIIKVVCSEEVCKKRLEEREKLKTSDSIVGYAHHLEVKEKIFEDYPQVNFVFDSSQEAESQYQKLQQLLMPAGT